MDTLASRNRAAGRTNNCIDLRDLNAFLQVAELRSFSKAAAQLRIAQSAISRRVLRLEHEFGVTLLERHARGVKLTNFGELLFKKAADVFRLLREIEASMMAVADQPSGHIRIAFPPATGQILAPIVIENFSRRYPRMTLHVMEGFTSSIQDWLISGKVDLAMLYNPEMSPDVVISELVTEQLYLIAPNPQQHPEMNAGNLDEIAFADLVNLPLILPGRTHSVRLVLERSASARALTPNIKLEADGLNIIKRLVESGLGYTIFNYAGVIDEIKRGSLRAIPITQPSLGWQLAMVSRRDQLASVVFCDLQRLIRSEFERLLAEGFYRKRFVTDAPIHVPAPS